MSDKSYKNVALYPHSAAHAREHGELDAYRASYKANIACKEAIEKAINENYHNNRLDSNAASPQLGEKFAEDRIAYVLAATVRHKDWDGRISPDNKAWAKTIPVCEDVDAWQQDRSVYFVVDQAHPGLVDLFVSHFRKEQEHSKTAPEKKPSVLAKLREKAAESEVPTAIPGVKEAER